MNSNNTIYGQRSNGLNHGDVFTSPEVIRFILDMVGYKAQSDLSNVLVLEPSFGNGDFLLEIQTRIIKSSKKYGFNPLEAFKKCVYACEIDPQKFNSGLKRLQVLMPDFYPSNFKNEDFLFSDWNVKFDVVIGNPPYVRYENIPDEIRSKYKSQFKTFHYRCDLYVLFYEHSLGYLADGGRHCFICSNRWLKNEYGKKLRELIGHCYNLERIVDVENLDAFQESVLAYPAISIIEKCKNKRKIEIASVDKLANLNNEIQYNSRTYSEGEDLNVVFSSDDYKDFLTIEEQQFSIGIGVATGADRIFISKDLDGIIEEELLMPIISARDLTGNKLKYNGLSLLNPYDHFGKPVDLELYPKAKAYLELHKQTLQNRHIVRHNRVWYSLIDKVKPDLLHKSKILLPDISANTYIFVDEGNFYPSHNIYYITSNTQDNERLLILAAFLMSDAVRKQLEVFSNKMNGGFPRWQSQVLRKLRIPCICDINDVYKKELLSAYHRFDIREINRIVNIIWNIPPSKRSYKNKKKSYTQLFLFDT